MDQTFHTLFDLDETAVVGDVRDLAEDAGIRRITPRQIFPRVRAELLEAERNAVALAIELQHLDLQFLPDGHDFRRMLDPLPGHVGDMQQTVDATEVDERTVVGQVLDDARELRAFLQILQQALALGAVFLFDHRTTRHDNVVALTVELDDLELERRTLECNRIADRAHIDQRPGQERPNEIDIDRETAANTTTDHAGYDGALLESVFEPNPGSCALCLFTRESRFAETVFDGIEGHFDLVTDRDFQFAGIIQELAGRNYRF